MHVEGQQPHQLDETQLAIIMRGHIAFQLLSVALDTKLFDFLAKKPSTTEEIGRHLEWRPWPTRLFVRGLLVLGLIERRDGRFHLPPLAEKHLVSDRPGFFGPEIGQSALIEYAPMSRLGASLQENTNRALDVFVTGEGKTLYERMHATKNKELQQLYYRGMGGRSNRTVDGFLSAFDYSSMRRVLDFCGGDGTNAIALARAYPNVRVTVLDLPTVCEIAARKIEAAGLSGRIDTFPCDVFSGLPPSGFDGVLYFHFFPMWTLERNAQLLRNCHAALNPGGHLLIYAPACEDDDSGPIESALLSFFLFAMATGEGGFYTGAEYADALRQVGFTDVQRKKLTDNMRHELVFGAKAR